MCDEPLNHGKCGVPPRGHIVMWRCHWHPDFALDRVQQRQREIRRILVGADAVAPGQQVMYFYITPNVFSSSGRVCSLSATMYVRVPHKCVNNLHARHVHRQQQCLHAFHKSWFNEFCVVSVHFQRQCLFRLHNKSKLSTLSTHISARIPIPEVSRPTLTVSCIVCALHSTSSMPHQANNMLAALSHTAF